jgi:hypothetical protein
MASSTLLQKLDKVTDPLVAGTVGSTDTTMDRSQSEWFIAGAAIALGDWVAFDATQTAIPDRVLVVLPCANVALGNALTVGVAKAAAASGARVQVVISGVVSKAKVVAGVAAAGVPLAIVANTVSAEANVAANIAPPCGVSLEASAAGFAACWVYKYF